jgi:hypothetical protein
MPTSAGSPPDAEACYLEVNKGREMQFPSDVAVKSLSE